MSTDAKDLRSVGARLGQARDIATAAADEFRRRHFSGRHPVLMFLLLPIALLPLLWAALLVVLLLVAKALGLESGGANLDGPVAATMTAWMPTILFVVLLLPIIAAAACMCRLAMRTGVNRKWMVLACSLVAILGGAAVVNVALPTTTAKGALTFGFGVTAIPSLSQAVRFAVPLAICGWVLWREAKVSNTPVTA